MRRIILYFLLFVFTYSCIEEYYPESDSSDEVIVIDAVLKNIEGRQSIRISKSSSVTQPGFNTVHGCFVEIIEEGGLNYEYEESTDGIYRHNFQAGDLKNRR